MMRRIATLLLCALFLFGCTRSSEALTSSSSTPVSETPQSSAVSSEVPERELTPFEKICAEIPYPGMRELPLPTAEEFSSRFGVSMDEIAYEIAALLSRVGKMEHDVSSPLELEVSRLYYHVVCETPYFSTDPNEPDRYEESLVPIGESVSAKGIMLETMFWIGNHLSQTAKLLYGDDFVLDLSKGETFRYRYYPEEGVVTPPHMGGGYQTIPLVLSYEETADGYRAEVVYLFDSMDGISEWGIEKSLTDQELPDYIKNQAKRAEVTVRREGDGRLCFVSYQVKP